MGKIVFINGRCFLKTKPDFWAMEKHAENVNRGCTDLHAVYKSFSRAKWMAYHDCLNFMEKVGGFNGSVINGNTFKFTFGFYFYETDEETGEILHEYFCKITDCHNYVWEV